MPNHYENSYSTDKASLRYYSYYDLLISKLKILKHLGSFKSGKAVILRNNVEIRITSGGKIFVDDHSVIENDVNIVLTKPKPYLMIGKNVLIGKGSLIYCKKKIAIGHNTRMGAYCTIRDHMHKDVNSKNTVIKSESTIKDVTISDDVWIGNYVSIFPGVKVGKNSIISTYSVVTESVPANVQVAGQPARIIKKLK